MKKLIFEQDVPALACGAKYLGSGGGGGKSHLMQLLTRKAIRDCGPVALLSPFDLPDEEWAIPVDVMGSPTILSEKVPSGLELLHVFRALEKQKGIKGGAVVGLHGGGPNIFTPVLTAAMANLPLLDANGTGRAFTELQMTTYHSFGISAAPLLMANEKGELDVITSESNGEVERVARKKVVELGGWAAIAGYPMQIHQVREASIHQALSFAKRLGEAVLAAGENIDRVVASMDRVFANSFYGTPVKLMEGKVVELERSTRNGSLGGSFLLEGTGYNMSEHLEVIFENEYLLVKQGSEHRAMIPDLICVLDADKGTPLLIEELENYMKLWVVAIPAPALVRSQRMLNIVGPQKYGLANRFTPVELYAMSVGGRQPHASTGN